MRFSKLFLSKFSWVLRNRWDFNWKQSTIMYNARGEGLTDIRNVFKNTSEGDVVLQAVADKFKRFKEIDKRALEVARYVNKIISYKHDKDNYGKVEYWASPYEVFIRRIGDCDDYALLMKDLLDKADIPTWRSKVAAGDTDSGGHAYVLYLKEKDNEWYTLEGSYYSDEAFTRFHNDISHKYAERYGRLWWTTRKDMSWAQHDLIIKKGL